MSRYPAIAFLFYMVVTIHSVWTGSAPYLGFWGHFWFLICGTFFSSLGMMGGEYFRRFTMPDLIAARDATEMFSKKMFWRVGPQMIGGAIGLMACSGVMKNFLGYTL